MSNHASCLIKTRLYHIGFPERFQYYPEGMSANTLDQVHAAALEMMRYPKDISASDRIDRCAFVIENYLVLGVAGFLKNLLLEQSAEFNGFCDASNIRETYGFFAYVWDIRSQNDIPRGFPGRETFAALVREMILPHWTKQDYSLQGEAMSRGIAEAYRFDIPDGETHGEAPLALNAKTGMCAIHYTDDAIGALNAAFDRIVQSRAGSVRTASQGIMGEDTVFDNWIVSGPAQAQPELRPKTKKAQPKQPEKQIEKQPEIMGKPSRHEPESILTRPDYGKKPAERCKGDRYDGDASVPVEIVLDFYSLWLVDDMDWEIVVNLVSSIAKNRFHMPGRWESILCVDGGIQMSTFVNSGEWSPEMKDLFRESISRDIDAKQRKGQLQFVDLNKLRCYYGKETDYSSQNEGLPIIVDLIRLGKRIFSPPFQQNRKRGSTSQALGQPDSDEEYPFGAGAPMPLIQEIPQAPRVEKKPTQKPSTETPKKREKPFDF